MNENENENPAPDPGPRLKRILLVEDEPMARLQLLEALRRSGLEVEVAANGRIALEKFQISPPDAIFMDLLLPAVKGVDLIKEARRNPDFGDRPIYVCTSAARLTAWAQRGTKAGATKVFDRAVTPVDVIAAQLAAELGVTSASVTPNPPATASASPAGQPGTKSLERRSSETEAVPVAGVGARAPLIKRVFQSFRKPKPVEQAQPSPSPIVPPQNSATVKEKAGSPGFVPAPRVSATRPPVIASAPHHAPSLDGQRPSGPVADHAAIVCFNESGIIVSANGCQEVFGWEGAALVGQSLSTLVKEGTDREVMEFIQQRLQGNSADGSQSLSVIARRKDGTEFCASVRTVIWSNETNFTYKSDTARLSWTAVFRPELSLESPAPAIEQPAQFDEAQASEPVHDSSLDPIQNQNAGAELQAAYEEIRRQFESVSAEAATLREVQARQCQDSEELVRRINGLESELTQARTALEQERGERGKIHAKSEELAGALAAAQKNSKQQSATDEQATQKAIQLTRDLEEAKGSLGRTEAALKDRAATCEKLEAELHALRQQILTLSSRTTPPASNQRSQESRPPGEQFESEHGPLLAPPEAKGDAGLHRDLEAELSAAKAAAQVAEACMREEVQRAQSFEQRLNILCTNLKQEQSERGKRFEEELTRHRTERETLKQQLATAEATAEKTRHQAEDLEKRLTDNSADLVRVSAELENRTNEHQRSEVELRKQLETTEAQSKKLKEALRQAETRATGLQQELAALQQGRADLSARLNSEQQAAAEIQFRVGDLEERLRQNSAELERVKTERDCAVGQKSSEMDMANLYHMRDLLAGKLEIEQRVAAESTDRAQGLEEQLRSNSAELERVKKALDKNSREKTQLENKLQTQVNAAKAAAAEAETNLKQKLSECSRLQKDLGNLQQARDDLRVQLKLAQQAAVDASEKNEQFEQKLRERAAELEQVKTEQLRQAEDQKRIEAELQAQLLSAKAATERAEASSQEEAQRNRTFEQRLLILGNTLKREEMERTRRMQEELDIVRRTCEELTQKHTAAQKATEDGNRQVEQLNQQLQASAQELQRLKTDQASRGQEHSRIQSDLNAQLQANKASLEKTAAALKEKTDASSQLQSELQKARTELGGQLTTAKQETADARKQAQELTQQLQASRQDLERLKADQTTHSQEQARTQSELQAQLQTTKATAEKTEAALKQKNEACAQLQSELQKARTELGGQLTTAKQETADARNKMQELAQQLQASQQELNRIKAEQTKHAQEQTRAQSDLGQQLLAARQEVDRLKADQARHTQEQTRAQSELHTQLQATKTAVEKAEAALKQKNEAYGHLQGEFQKTRTELGGQLTTSKRDGAEARKQAQELTQQLQAAKKSAEKAETSLKEKTEQLAQAQSELTKHQQALAKTKRQGKDLEKQQVDHASELAKLQATVAEHKAAREKLEAQLRERENEASTRAGLESENQNLAEARATLSAELCLLREGHVSLEAQLAESQRQVHDSVARIDRATADLEKERGERRRAENRVDSLTGQLQELHGQIKAHLDAEAAVHGRIGELEKHLRESEDQVGRVNDDLQKERTDRQLLEQQLKTADVLSGQLRNCLTSFDVAKEGFKRAQVQLETKLKSAQEALKESDAKLQKEIADRLRQEEALAQARQAVQAHSQGSAAELAKLTAELEEERLERKRIEGNIVQSRYASFDSARAGLSMVNRLRTQVREPVDGLMQSTRLLLEAELEDEHRKLVETVLEKAVLLQRTLQEAGTLGACSTRPDNASPTDGDNARSGDATSTPSRGKQP